MFSAGLPNSHPRLAGLLAFSRKPLLAETLGTLLKPPDVVVIFLRCDGRIRLLPLAALKGRIGQRAGILVW